MAYQLTQWLHEMKKMGYWQLHGFTGHKKRALHRNPSGVAYLAPQDAKLRVASTHFSQKNYFSQNFNPYR